MRRCLNQLERLPYQARARVARYLVEVAVDSSAMPSGRGTLADPRQLALPGTEGDEIP